jgi:hypothetical protein
VGTIIVGGIGVSVGRIAVGKGVFDGIMISFVAVVVGFSVLSGWGVLVCELEGTVAIWVISAITVWAALVAMAAESAVGGNDMLSFMGIPCIKIIKNTPPITRMVINNIPITISNIF